MAPKKVKAEDPPAEKAAAKKSKPAPKNQDLRACFAAVSSEASDKFNFGVWRPEVISSSRSYYEQRKNPWFQALFERCAKAKKHPQCKAFEEAEGLELNESTLWSRNPKETCDKFDAFVKQYQGKTEGELAAAPKKDAEPGATLVDSPDDADADASAADVEMQDDEAESVSHMETVPATFGVAETTQDAGAMGVGADPPAQETGLQLADHDAETKNDNDNDTVVAETKNDNDNANDDVGSDPLPPVQTGTAAAVDAEQPKNEAAAAAASPEVPASSEVPGTSEPVPPIQSPVPGTRLGQHEVRKQTTVKVEVKQEQARQIIAKHKPAYEQCDSVEFALVKVERRIAADIDCRTSSRNGHLPELHPEWPDLPSNEFGVNDDEEPWLLMKASGACDQSVIQPPRYPCPNVDESAWMMNVNVPPTPEVPSVHARDSVDSLSDSRREGFLSSLLGQLEGSF